MNGAFYDATNIFWKLRYQKLYDAVLATPLGPKDIAVGETAWALFRGLVYAVGFFTIMVVHAEPGVDEDALARLEAEGREVRRWPARHHYFGGVSLVARRGAAGDPRRSGHAASPR